MAKFTANLNFNPGSFSSVDSFVVDSMKANFTNVIKTGRFTLSAYQSWAKNYTKELGRAGKGASFILSQTAYSLLNPNFGMGKIYNPAAVVYPPAFAGGFVTNKLDVPSAESNPGERIARNQDKLKRLYEGTLNGQLRNSKGQNLDDIRREINIAHPKGNGAGDGPLNNKLVIDAEGSSNFGIVKQEEVLGVITEVPSYEDLFTKKKGLSLFEGEKGGDFYLPTNRVAPSPEYRKKRAVLRHDNVFFSYNDQINGYILENELTDLNDDDFYVPFFFQDLRKPDRKIFFRAFLSSFQEKFDPTWNKISYYGRTESSGIYEGTDRSISISFYIASMTSQGLTTMWKKINNITKMFYPTKINGVLKAAPLVRIRIGDVICRANGDGLAGWIESPNFDYNEMPWETAKWDGPGPDARGKAPQICKMSFNFKIIHDFDPYIDDEYNMDIGNIRRIGDTQERSQSQIDTEQENNDQTDAITEFNRGDAT